MRAPVGLLLDSNDWSADEQIELEKLLNMPGRSSIAFLKRPEIEDYLIHSGAIARLLTQDARTLNLKDEITKMKVDDFLGAIGKGTKGSDILNRCFSGLIVGHEFAKNRDCQRLAEAILADEPELLRPLYIEIVTFLGSVGSLAGAQARQSTPRSPARSERG